MHEIIIQLKQVWKETQWYPFVFRKREGLHRTLNRKDRFEISNQRDSCIAKARIKRSKERIDALKKNRKDCNEKRKVKKCKKAVDKRIDYEKEIIEKNEKKLANLKKQGRA